MKSRVKSSSKTQTKSDSTTFFGKSDFGKSMNNMYDYTNNYISSINDSKMFAGLMIITLNIASKFVTIKLSKTMESYLKYTFSKQLLVFVMAWMGSRQIYTAIIITILFIICTEFLFNEESRFCCLSEAFTDYHISKLENDTTSTAQLPTQQSPSPTTSTAQVTPEEIKHAEAVLEKAKTNRTQLQIQKTASYQY
jgi:hypothetical protein